MDLYLATKNMKMKKTLKKLKKGIQNKLKLIKNNLILKTKLGAKDI